MRKKRREEVNGAKEENGGEKTKRNKKCEVHTHIKTLHPRSEINANRRKQPV